MTPEDDCDEKACPCGSDRRYGECCSSALRFLRLQPTPWEQGPLTGWLESYARPLERMFLERARSHYYLLSTYLGHISDAYAGAPYPNVHENVDRASWAYCSVKNNIVLSIAAGGRCLAAGMFLQCGALLRSAVEDSIVLLDLALGTEQMTLFLQGKYDGRSALKRRAKLLPQDLRQWYGDFSANFTHAGPLHRAGHMPRACHFDSYVLANGFTALMRAIVAFHVCLERSYLSEAAPRFFWTTTQGGEPAYDENSAVFRWTRSIQDEIRQSLDQEHIPTWLIRSDEKVGMK